MERHGGLYSLLALPAIYRFFGRVVGGSCRRIHIEDYVRPRSGEKVLDIGCGPGDILDHLPPLDYVGFDISPQYIAAAQQRFGNRGRFFCGDVGRAQLDAETGAFDIALATGVVHHLDDPAADQLFALAAAALKPGGRLITFDGCIAAGQSPLARWIVRRDRGQFVRSPEAYERLARRHFAAIESAVRHDLLRMPYTHFIMCCRAPQRSSS